MKSLLRAAAFAPVLLVFAGCTVGQPDDNEDATSTDADALQRASRVSRGMEWVDAKLHYCQASHGAVDFDNACWAWEGSSHRCERTSNAAWNAYRSDCSGFVTYAWGLPPVGDGGYVTSDFAPFSNKFSHTIDGHSLEPGDALNKTSDEHIILFKAWANGSHTSAVFVERTRLLVVDPLRARVHVERLHQRRQGVRELRRRDVLRDSLQQRDRRRKQQPSAEPRSRTRRLLEGRRLLHRHAPMRQRPLDLPRGRCAVMLERPERGGVVQPRQRLLHAHPPMRERPLGSAAGRPRELQLGTWRAVSPAQRIENRESSSTRPRRHARRGLSRSFRSVMLSRIAFVVVVPGSISQVERDRLPERIGVGP